ncbi:MAG: presenilin family intramembrane aspartyl protease PSH [Candidatus Thermoplasmatota archaeon]
MRETPPATSIPAVLAMGILFAFAIILAMLTSCILPPSYKVFGEDTSSLLNPILFILLVLAFTGFVLLMLKLKNERFIQLLILCSIGICIIYVSYPPLSLFLSSNLALCMGFFLAIFLLILLYIHPEWYVVDITGIFLASGICAILGISLGTLPALILLLFLAIYDALAVYKTKHMITLADGVMSMRLPILLVIPKTLSYSFLTQKSIMEEGERGAMFMGLGDIIIPGTLVISAFTYLEKNIVFLSLTGNILVALSTLFGALVGFSILMIYVLKGKPQAGLPLINCGTIIGYLLSAYIVYRNFGLTLPTW